MIVTLITLLSSLHISSTGRKRKRNDTDQDLSISSSFNKSTNSSTVASSSSDISSTSSPISDSSSRSSKSSSSKIILSESSSSENSWSEIGWSKSSSSSYVDKKNSTKCRNTDINTSSATRNNLANAIFDTNIRYLSSDVKLFSFHDRNENIDYPSLITTFSVIL